MRGHLLPLVTRTAFSTDTESLGRPSVFHCLISTGVARMLTTLKSSETGIFNSLQLEIHPLKS